MTSKAYYSSKTRAECRKPWIKVAWSDYNNQFHEFDQLQPLIALALVTLSLSLWLRHLVLAGHPERSTCETTQTTQGCICLL